LHWAQVKIYGWLLCQKLGFSSIRLALVYFDIISRKETLLSGTYDAGSLKQYFETNAVAFSVGLSRNWLTAPHATGH
jgi:DNA excision repair protein ERCC-2